MLNAIVLIDNIFRLKKNGILFITINKSLPFILNTNTEVLRKKIYRMPKKKSDLLVKNIAELGQSIRKLNKKITIKKDLKYIGISKGSYKVHDLIHYHLFRNFSNLDWPFKASLNHNRDW